eukprot:767179-Hanusia_phi.AAC.2
MVMFLIVNYITRIIHGQYMRTVNFNEGDSHELVAYHVHESIRMCTEWVLTYFIAIGLWRFFCSYRNKCRRIEELQAQVRNMNQMHANLGVHLNDPDSDHDGDDDTEDEDYDPLH